MVQAFKVLFATDADYAELITDILAECECKGNLYSVIHNCFSKIIKEDNVELSLCLPSKRPGGNKKLLEVFRLSLDTNTAKDFLFSSKPLAASLIKKTFNRREACKNFMPLIEVLTNNHCRDVGNLSGLINWYRAKFVSGLRRLYKLSSSPYWLINTFGANESSFVFVSCHYFFIDCVCTIDTLSHLSFLFDQERGTPLATISTFQELSKTFNDSKFLTKVPTFFNYVQNKLNRDDIESACLDECIDQFRSQLVLSDQDLVHYIYLSFFQCLNRKSFYSYSMNTCPNQLAALKSDSLLVENMDVDFKKKMSTYYNKETYLSHHIKIRHIFLKHEMPGYSNTCTASVDRRDTLLFWSGEIGQVSGMLHEINEACPDAGLSEDLQGFLDLAASGVVHSSLGDPKCFISQDCETLKMPVFRCEFLNKHYFITTWQDNISQFWIDNICYPDNEKLLHDPDEALNRCISYTDLYFSLQTLKDQMYISRHEYFNPKLPVFNWVLDFDLELQEQILSFEEIYKICTTIRESIIDILKLLGQVEDSHQVYFFKSACPKNIEGLEFNEQPFCICRQKLGMRVVTPFPKGVTIIGSKNMIELTNILNRLIKLNEHVTKVHNNIKNAKGPFDTGIYNKGRCIRLPHTYKVERNGRLERCLKMLICHPIREQRLNYVKNALTLKNLLHHSLPYEHDTHFKTIYLIEDVNENFLNKQTKKHLPPKQKNVLTILQSLIHEDVIDLVTQRVWPKCIEVIKDCMPDDKVHQFQRVMFHTSGQNIIHIKPERGSNFKCLKYNHRGNSKTVRVFLILHLHSQTKLVLTFMSQCFTNKCNNNRPTAHFSVSIDI